MQIGTITSVVLSLALSSAVQGASWTSPDGNMGFDHPEPNSPKKKFSGSDLGAKFGVLALVVAGVVWVIRKIVT